MLGLIEKERGEDQEKEKVGKQKDEPAPTSWIAEVEKIPG